MKNAVWISGAMLLLVTGVVSGGMTGVAFGQTKSTVQRQPSGPPMGGMPMGGPPQFTEAERTKFEAYRPVMQLVREVNILDRLTSAGKLTLSAAQAKQVVPLLKGLAARKDIKPDAAKMAQTSLHKILTPAQIQQLEAERPPRGGRFGRPGGPGGPPPNGMPPPPRDGEMPPPPFGGPNANRNGRVGPPPGGMPPGHGRSGGPNGGPMEAIRTGKPFNPFAPTDPFVGQATKNLIARLSKTNR
jgi:hypothetical protein